MKLQLKKKKWLTQYHQLALESLFWHLRGQASDCARGVTGTKWDKPYRDSYGSEKLDLKNLKQGAWVA